MDVLNAIACRRMYRAFTADPVGDEALGLLVEAATRAPMAANVPVRRIVVVTDRRVLRTIRQLTPGLAVEPPALLALCTDIRQAEDETGAHGRDISSWIDAGAAAENVALAATELGLGVSFARSCTDPALRVALDLPDHVRPDLLVAVGHVAAGAARPPKRPRQPVFRDRYGVPWEPGSA